MTLPSHLITWLASSDQGLSSRAILAWLARDLTIAALDGNRFEYPRDPADLGRCIRLLDIEPSYRSRIEEMGSVSPQWARLAGHWRELETLFREEEPSGRAPKTYDLMQELIKGKANR